MTENITLKKVQNLRLDRPVVHRRVPMNQHGCDMIRAIRDYQVERLLKQEGLEVEIQYPTAIHLMMQDYVDIKGIKVEPTKH